jgi:preprotein translocase subunit SecF
MENFEKFYDKNYKKILIIPAVLLTISLLFILVFYIQTGDIIAKDVTLTGGTSISIFTKISPESLEEDLSKKISDFSIKTISDNSGNQIQIVIIVKEEDTNLLKSSLEEILGEELTIENSSIETTSASLSEDFYKQLIVAVLLAFFWMAAVVFLIFAKGRKIKTRVVLINILFGLFMGKLFLTANKIISGIIFLAFASILIYTYIKNSVPAFAVMLSAFANITMTLALVDLIGIKLSSAGIVAFLMLIGYSVDTDILLTTRILKKRESINKALLGAFKTGTTMTITSIIAVTTALIAVYSFSSVLNQIFTILLIGLGFDLFNTWLTNASILKWYAEGKE